MSRRGEQVEEQDGGAGFGLGRYDIINLRTRWRGEATPRGWALQPRGKRETIAFLSDDSSLLLDQPLVDLLDSLTHFRDTHIRQTNANHQLSEHTSAALDLSGLARWL
ncbi:hypothetical protein KFL_009550030 [Klebsormidium nitens]|uniref:Uncharacterized protein n=1 Tax=Klebsormidium nitens TaxID=105231 RepID=A0A1Y1IND3_KLENI|nr:hypothetical protein KFL_009550030 [Klebsormidium nitens]|eukprot:GAQ92244.1 hypothetical protein KFL_009550030 [Klebsormidium nitens]